MMTDIASSASFRSAVPDVGDERTLLDAMLDFHRGTLRWKCHGLSPEQMTTSAVPTSALTLAGIVRHLAENERWWFRRQAGQLDLHDLYATDEEPDADLLLAEVDSVATDLDRYDAEVTAAKEAVTDVPLDHEFSYRLPGRDPSPMSLRFVYLHMIEEYARHNGHVDLLREALDGTTGE